MKRYIFIVIAIMCGVCAASAQLYEETQRRLLEQPRTVLNEARVALEDAICSDNSPQLIDALMLLSAAQLHIDNDSIATVSHEVEQVMNRCSNQLERSVIALYLSQLYNQYLAAHYHALRYRSHIENNPDMKTWSVANFITVIDSLQQLALQPCDVLQLTPASRYAAIIGIDGVGDDDRGNAWQEVMTFYPTMYDIVASLIYNSHLSHHAISHESAADIVMPMLNHIIAYHTAHNNNAPCFMWELKRAQYGYRLSNDKQAYDLVLDSLIHRYASHDYVIDAVLARYEYVMGATSPQEIDTLYKELQRWIVRYPSYVRTSCLRSMCATLSATSVAVTLPQALYLGDSIVVDVTYSNADSITYRLSQCDVKNPLQNISDALQLDDRLMLSGAIACEGIDFDTHERVLELAPQAEGVYKLEIEAGGIKKQAVIAVMPYMLLVVEDIPHECIVMLLDNKSGHPIVGQKLLLTDKQGRVVKTLRTDAHGLCRVEATKDKEPLYVSVARLSSYPMKQRIGFVGERSRTVPTSVQLFTDCALYRPGQMLYFSAIVYRMDSDVRRTMGDVDVPIELIDHDNNIVWSDTLRTDRYGSVSGEILLPEKASLGSWYLRVNGRDMYCARMIEVAEYKRPQFSVSCDDIAGIYNYGDSVQVVGTAVTYTQVPVMQAQVKYVVRRTSYYYGGGEEVASGTTTTDAQGRFAFDFVTAEPVDELMRYWGTRYLVEVIVTSQAGESQQCEAVVSVAGSGVMFRFNCPSIMCRNDNNSFQMTIVNGSGTPQSLPYSLSLYSLEDSSIGEPLSMMHRADAPLWQQDAHLDVTTATAMQRISLPGQRMASGAYRLIATTTTPAGEQCTDSVEFIFYSPHDTAPPILQPLWVPVTEYVVADGDTARVVVGSSFHDAAIYCFITDGDKRAQYRYYSLDNSNATINIPLDKECDDVMSMMLVLLREGEIYKKWITIRRRQPDAQLYITPITFRDKTIPGAAETWRFAVRDNKGNAVDALFMTELYDASLDALRAHSWHFAPQFHPYSLYRPGVYFLWEYRRNENLYFNYLNEYETAHCAYALQPVLNNYLSMIYGYGYNHFTMSSMNGTVSKRAAMTHVTFESAADEASVDMLNDAVSEEMAGVSAPASQEYKPIDYRSDMRETAFFYPHLVTDKEGNVAVEFTLPEANTTWNFFSLAITPQLQYGAYNATIVSTKPLMVSPNMPRFVRQGDEALLAVNITNTTHTALDGNAQVTLYNVYNNSDIVTLTRHMTIDADTVITLHFDVAIPDTLSLVGVRVAATTPLFSDGEQHLLPILPARTVVTEASPFYVRPEVTDTVITFDSMQKKMRHDAVENIRLTVEYCDNPMWYAVTALPPLAEPRTLSATSLIASLYACRVATSIVARNPTIAQAIATWSENSSTLASQLSLNEELKQLLLSQTPWLLEADNVAEQLQQIASLLDVERAKQLCANAVENLQALQHDGGGWSWYNGMQPSFVITLNTIQGLLQLKQWGESDNDEAISRMIMQGVKYLDSQYLRRNDHAPQVVDYDDLCYLYVRSACIDIPLTGEVLALHKAQLDSVASQWYRLDEIEKAYAAIVLYRYGYQGVAQQILNSLREYATINTAQGMFWANNRSNTFYRNSAIQRHCAIYKAFEMVSPRSSELDAMRQWLLLQKQTQSWGNVPSTLDAVDILLQSGSIPLSTGLNTRIEWGDEVLPDATAADAVMGYEKYVREGNAITATDAQITLTAHGEHPSWGAIYWQYSQEITQVDAHATSDISLQRAYYVERNGILVPIHSTTLVPGDVVTVRLTLFALRDMQFMTLVDNRPACFEPVQQLPAVQYNGALLYYCEPTQATHNMYFDFMPRGTHVVEYEVYVDRQGSYQAGIATLQSYYAPQYISHTGGAVVQVASPSY